MGLFCRPSTRPARRLRTWIFRNPDIGALLPCNMLLRANPDGGTDVAAADPRAMLALGPADLCPVAEEARERLEHALSALHDV